MKSAHVLWLALVSVVVLQFATGVYAALYEDPAAITIMSGRVDFDNLGSPALAGFVDYAVYAPGDYTGTIFDDEAQYPIEHGQPPFNGQFKPHSPDLLSHFDGQDAYGTWRLQIRDIWPYNAGQLDAFELIITVPEPSSFILLFAGLFCLRRKSRRRR